jgi:hypothetical protein
VTGVQTCALPISGSGARPSARAGATRARSGGGTRARGGASAADPGVRFGAPLVTAASLEDSPRRPRSSRDELPPGLTRAVSPLRALPGESGGLELHRQPSEGKRKLPGERKLASGKRKVASGKRKLASSGKIRIPSSRWPTRDARPASSRASPSPAPAAPRAASSTLPEPTALGCPRCGAGTLVTGQRGWGCSRWREGCHFVVWFQSFGRRVTAAQLRDLIQRGKTRKARFVTPAGAEIDARLVLEPATDGGAVRLEPVAGAG